MLALSATPELNCGFGPVFCRVCGKTKLPLSRSLHRLQTNWLERLPVPVLPSLSATAAVQLVGVTPPTAVLQYAEPAPPRAVSKNGCVGRVLTLATPVQPPPARPALPPQ